MKKKALGKKGGPKSSSGSTPMKAEKGKDMKAMSPQEKFKAMMAAKKKGK